MKKSYLFLFAALGYSILSNGQTLSSSPTLTFVNATGISTDNIASDGDGGSVNISDIEIQITNISDAAGTFVNSMTFVNNSWLASSDANYAAITHEVLSKGMKIKSVDGKEFKLDQFKYYNWGETESTTNTIKGYRDGQEVASMTFEAYDVNYTPMTVVLTSSFQNIDEARIYISAGGYLKNQSGTNHSINSIKVSGPVVPNTAPTDIALSANSIDENKVANSVIGTLSSTDANVGNTFTYTFVSGGLDNASFNIAGDKLRISSSPDFETKNSYSIKIKSTDQGGLSFEKEFMISVNNINDITPTISGISDDTGENSNDFLTKDNTLTIHGMAEPNSLITFSVNGMPVPKEVASAIANAQGEYAFVVPSTLPDGIASFEASSTLSGVTLKSTSRVVTIDTEASISIDTPIEGNDTIDIFEVNDIVINGVTVGVEANQTIVVVLSDGVSESKANAVVQANGTWTAKDFDDTFLGEGKVTVSASVSDKAGNEAYQEKMVYLDLRTVGTNPFDSNQSFVTVYPNPVVHDLNIINNKESDVTSIEVYNSNSELVSSNSNETVINMSELSAGVYFVKISTATNAIVKKIVKD